MYGFHGTIKEPFSVHWPHISVISCQRSVKMKLALALICFSLALCSLQIVSSQSCQIAIADNVAIDAAYEHLRASGIEGFRTRGYYPGGKSGVTIGAGVDLRFQSANELISKYRVPTSIVTKIEETGFLGKKGSDVSNPGSLVLTTEEAHTLSHAFVTYHYGRIKPYAMYMCQQGRNVLVSLRHWTGPLSNDGYVLAPLYESFELTNSLWPLIETKTGTDCDLKGKLSYLKLLHDFIGSANYIRMRLQNEIDHIQDC